MSRCYYNARDRAKSNIAPWRCLDEDASLRYLRVCIYTTAILCLNTTEAVVAMKRRYLGYRDCDQEQHRAFGGCNDYEAFGKLLDDIKGDWIDNKLYRGCRLNSYKSRSVLFNKIKLKNNNKKSFVSSPHLFIYTKYISYFGLFVNSLVLQGL